MPYYICSSVGKIFHFMLSRIASLVLWSNLLNGHFVITFFLLLSKKYENKFKKVVGLNKALNSCVISAWKSKTKKHDGGPWTKNPGRRARGGGPGAESPGRSTDGGQKRNSDRGAQTWEPRQKNPDVETWTNEFRGRSLEAGVGKEE